MKTKVQRLLIIVAAFVLVAGWIWRYNSLNTFYNSIYEKNRLTYHMGEIVPFGDDRFEMGISTNGYSIRLDDFVIMDLTDVLASVSVAEESIYTKPDKVVVAYATLFNENSEAPGIMLNDFTLHGIDNYANTDWELVQILNPILSEGYGISLSPKTEYQIILPFALYKNYFGTDTWHQLDQYDFYLHITSYPTEKDIQCW